MFKKVLALSPHTDDIELGCGATLHRLKTEGSEIVVYNYSFAAQTNIGVVKDEFITNMALLGARYEIFDFPVRTLQDHRQEILDNLYTIQKKENFDLVLCHSTFDVHQDHQVITNEAIRAFKNCTILGYELPWNCIEFTTDFFIEVSEEDLNFKKMMLDNYITQSDRPFMMKEYVYDLGRIRGLQCSKPYAEAFQNIRTIYSL